MFSSVLKSFLVKIRYGKNIKMHIYKNISFMATIKAKKANITLGKGLLLNRYSSVIAVNKGEIIIGDNVSFNQNSKCVAHKRIVIGKNTSIGPNVCIYDHDHKFGASGKMPGFNSSDIIIDENVWIGAGTIILRGTHIGKNCVIGAGCIIKGDIPENSLVTQNREMNIEKLENK